MTTENNQVKDRKELFKILEGLRRGIKEAHFTRANLWNQEVNETERALGNTLFTLATVLFVFTSPIFQRPDQFTVMEKTLLAVGWILLFFSIIFGLLQVVIDVRYLNSGAEVESAGEKLWSRTVAIIEDYDKLIEEDVKLYKNYKPHSEFCPFIIQAVSLLLAFGLILFTVVSALV